MTNLQQIISDLERQKAAIESALAALRGLSAGAPQPRGPRLPAETAGPGRPPEKRSNLSDEGRQRIAKAQRERWAAKKAAGKKAVSKTALSKTVASTGSTATAATKKVAGRKRSVPKKAAAKKSAPASQTA